MDHVVHLWQIQWIVQRLQPSVPRVLASTKVGCVRYIGLMVGKEQTVGNCGEVVRRSTMLLWPWVQGSPTTQRRRGKWNLDRAYLVGVHGIEMGKTETHKCRAGKWKMRSRKRLWKFRTGIWSSSKRLKRWWLLRCFPKGVSPKLLRMTTWRQRKYDDVKALNAKKEASEAFTLCFRNADSWFSS